MIEKRKLQKEFDKDMLSYYLFEDEFFLTKSYSSKYLPNQLKDSMVKLWILLNSS
jgi:hypothetical protein